MVVLIRSSAQLSTDVHPRRSLCNAHIPLFYLKGLSNGAIKILAKRLNITTIEELFLVDKEKITDKITQRRLRKEIFDAKQKITTRALVKKKVIKFEEYAMNRNIRIRPSQRQFLIAVSLFKEILNDVDKVLVYVLNIHDESIPFREKQLLKNLYKVSKKALKAA